MTPKYFVINRSVILLHYWHQKTPYTPILMNLITVLFDYSSGEKLLNITLFTYALDSIIFISRKG